jgi:hypothetical protein
MGLDLPKEISYKDGTMLRLLPVEKNNNRGNAESEKILYEEEIKA